MTQVALENHQDSLKGKQLNATGCIWTPPHCKQTFDDSHGATAYVYSASVVGIR